MNRYMFNTSATMKESDRGKWWIDKNIVPVIYVSAGNTKQALEHFAAIVDKEHYISISDNAKRNKQPMYIDTKDGEAKQIGYVITGKTSFDNDRGQWIDKYIDLWVDISVIGTPDFDNE